MDRLIVFVVGFSSPYTLFDKTSCNTNYTLISNNSSAFSTVTLVQFASLNLRVSADGAHMQACKVHDVLFY
jgi:hypothetical protein